MGGGEAALGGWAQQACPDQALATHNTVGPHHHALWAVPCSNCTASLALAGVKGVLQRAHGLAVPLACVATEAGPGVLSVMHEYAIACKTSRARSP